MLSPLPACFITEQSTGEASLFVNFNRSTSKKVPTHGGEGGGDFLDVDKCCKELKR